MTSSKNQHQNVKSTFSLATFSNSVRLAFSSTYVYQMDEWALPGNLDNQKFIYTTPPPLNESLSLLSHFVFTFIYLFIRFQMTNEQARSEVGLHYSKSGSSGHRFCGSKYCNTLMLSNPWGIWMKCSDDMSLRWGEWGRGKTCHHTLRSLLQLQDWSFQDARCISYELLTAMRNMRLPHRTVQCSKAAIWHQNPYKI